jgi:hypothetical protein
MFDLGRRLAPCAAGCLLAFSAAAETPAALAHDAKLCLYPMGLPFSETQTAKRRPALEKKLIAELSAAKFRVADPDAVEALEKRVRTEVGGSIDPALGWRDAERFRVYSEHLARALKGELGCDGQLFASVVSLRAGFVGGTARWDGTSQAISSGGRQALHLFAGVEERGWVAALSLWLEVLDLPGNAVAFRSAGIETPVSLAVVEDQDLVPEDRWLMDEARLDQAIRSAIGAGGDGLRRNGRP